VSLLAGSARSDAGLVCVQRGGTVVLCRCGLRYSSTVGSPPAVDHGTAEFAACARGKARVRPADRADRPSWDRNREDARLNLKTRPRWIAGYYIPAPVPARPSPGCTDDLNPVFSCRFSHSISNLLE
jgi:hypothetical protein